MLICYEVTQNVKHFRLKAGQLIWWEHEIDRAWTDRVELSHATVIELGESVRWIRPGEVSDRGLTPPRYPGNPISTERLVARRRAELEQLRRERLFTDLAAFRSLGLVR